MLLFFDAHHECRDRMKGNEGMPRLTLIWIIEEADVEPVRTRAPPEESAKIFSPTGSPSGKSFGSRCLQSPFSVLSLPFPLVLEKHGSQAETQSGLGS